MVTKDYKHISDRDKNEKKSCRSPKLIFLIGFVSGVIAFFLASFIYFNYAPQREIVVVRDPVKQQPSQKDKDSDAESYDYEFFKILRDMEIVVPENEDDNNALRHTYILQVGSFRLRKRAEMHQKRLKMLNPKLNLEPQVQVVEMKDDGIWHRVTLGPYDNLSRVKNLKNKLRKQGVESLLKKH